jgi:thioredoxin family protein
MPGQGDGNRRRLLRAMATSIAAARLGIFGSINARAFGATLETSDELSSLANATTWLNSAPLTAGGLRGKIVLIDIWTYTCINWLRTLPYVRAWHRKYESSGLVVIGVHAPEFTFEHDLDNVRRAARELDVGYPVAIDNAFLIWRAFDNRFWPSLYLIDARGRIRYSHFGEGEYERSEREIQDQLERTGAHVEGGLVSVQGQGAQAGADWSNLKTPEIYLGHRRTENFSSSDGGAASGRRVHAAPAELRRNHWALAGDWTVMPEFARLNRAGGRISCAFHARDLHLVMGPAKGGAAVRFRVLLDGQPPGNAHGGDIDQHGYGMLDGQRLYQLIRQPKPIRDRQFSIEFLGAGPEGYALTFG